MLGEYAQEMHDATYILESLIENWEEENAHEVRLHLLTATMKCFFKRPPETQKALGAALAAGLAESHQDVHDRALFYYRLLQCDASTAECVVNPPKQAVSVFADSQSSEIKDRVFDEFNTLSVVYQKPSYMFTDKEHQGPFEVSEEIINLSVGGESIENVIPAERYKETDNDLLLTTSEKEENGVSNTNGSTASGYIAPFDFNASLPALGPPTQSGPGNSNSGLPAIDDLLGLGALSSSVPAAPLPPSLMLNPKTALDPGTFQRKWGQLSASFSQECSMNPQGIATPTTPTPQALIPHMQGNYINCIASGGQPPNLKFFFYAQMLDGSSSFFLVECIINTASGKAQVKVRADDGSESEAFSTLFHSALLNLGLS